MITIYTMAFNEEVFLQYMIDHYRERFPNCNIVLYDNESTDNTVNIAKLNNCKIINFSTNNEIDDDKIKKLKNNCWKSSNTDWVLICDLDELLDINQESLKKEEENGATIIRSEGWTMVNMEDNLDLKNIKHGYRSQSETAYDKCMLFNKKYINEINYLPGAHQCSPKGNVKYGNIYKMYHYRFINPDIEVKKYFSTIERLSEDNKRCGMGKERFIGSAIMTEAQVRADFNGRRCCPKILE